MIRRSAILLLLINVLLVHNIQAQVSAKVVEQIKKDLGVELSFSAKVQAGAQEFSTNGTILFDGTDIAVQTATHNIWYNGKDVYTLQKNEMYNELYISVPQDADSLLFQPLVLLASSKTECNPDNRLKRIYGEYSDYTFDIRIDRYIRSGVKFDSSVFVPQTDSIPNLEIIDLR